MQKYAGNMQQYTVPNMQVYAQISKLEICNICANKHKYDKYAKTKYAHICKYTVYHKHKYAQNMHKYAKPNMHKMKFQNMYQNVLYILKYALYAGICMRINMPLYGRVQIKICIKCA